MTADVRRTPRRGTSSRMRIRAHAADAGTRDRCMRSADASFARSFDPCASILTMHGGAKSVFVVGRSFRHHGWANPREWEEPTLGSVVRTLRGSPHATASARERAWHGLEKEGGRGLRPCEDLESGLVCSHVVVQLQKSAGDLWSRISSANALQKERSGSSERGPSSSFRSAGETVGRLVERRESRESASPPSRERIGARPRVARERHPAVAASPKAMPWSRDRGCNDHRIL